MDNETKIHLSPLERELVNNSEWILTKNAVLNKVEHLLEQVQENVAAYVLHHANRFPSEVTAITPKISKGEKYQGLPWLILDYPRFFDRQNIFAIRSMFWWGHFFSSTLHLSGRYKEECCSPLTSAYEELSKNHWYACVSQDQWHHHFDKENYRPVSGFTEKEFAQCLAAKDFLKLSYRFPVSEWDNAVKILTGEFVRIADCLA